jgi:hypothetical protein
VLAKDDEMSKVTGKPIDSKMGSSRFSRPVATVDSSGMTSTSQHMGSQSPTGDDSDMMCACCESSFSSAESRGRDDQSAASNSYRLECCRAVIGLPCAGPPGHGAGMSPFGQ